jgi:two-component system, OmpR family, response regulator
MKILIVDDAVAVRLVARWALTRYGGFDVLEAADGVSALATARRELPAAILLDAELPELPGERVLRALRDDQATAAIPVVLLGADVPDRAELAALGVDGAIGKPVDPHALVGELAALLAGPAPFGHRLLDEERLAGLTRDGRTWRELVALYRASSAQAVSEMQAAARAGSGERLRAAARRLGEASESLGFVAVATLCEALARAGASGRAAIDAERWAHLSAILDLTVEEARGR